MKTLVQYIKENYGASEEKAKQIKEILKKVKSRHYNVYSTSKDGKIDFTNDMKEINSGKSIPTRIKKAVDDFAIQLKYLFPKETFIDDFKQEAYISVFDALKKNAKAQNYTQSEMFGINKLIVKCILCSFREFARENFHTWITNDYLDILFDDEDVKKKTNNSTDISAMSHKMQSDDNDLPRNIIQALTQDTEDNEAFDRLMRYITTTITDKYDKKTCDIFYSYYGINGYDKMKNKELAEKYGINNSAISYYLKKCTDTIKNDRKVRQYIEKQLKESLDEI